MTESTESPARRALLEVAADPVLRPLVDATLPIPQVFRGSRPIKLVILGQDPTVKNERERAKIRVVLNLDRPRGNLHRYLTRVCQGLGLELDRDVYATNYVKCFFVRPPTQIEEVDVLAQATRYWLPLLHDELAEFGDVPVISLGQPLLKALVLGDASPLVRDYWGYRPGWQSGERGEKRCLGADQNRLQRVVFPFPHQPSAGKRFYKERLEEYLAFVRAEAGLSQAF